MILGSHLRLPKKSKKTILDLVSMMQTLTSLARSLPHVLGAVIGPKDNLMYPSNSWKILGQTSIINNNNLSA